MSKKNELVAYLHESNPPPDLICIVEIKPKHGEALSQEALLLPGYKSPWHNLGEEGRGIAVWVRMGVNITTADMSVIKDNGFIESMWMELPSNSKSRSPCIIGCVYRSPSSGEGNALQLNQLIQQICDKRESVLIFGDFNYPSINWDDMDATGVRRIDKLFHVTVLDNFLFQHVDQPTRYRHGQNPTLDDLVLSSDPDLIKDIQYLHPLGKSDHVCISMKVIAEPVQEENKAAVRYMYNRGNYDEIRKNLGMVNWEDRLSCVNSNEAWKIFKTLLHGEVEANIPKSKPIVGKGKKMPYVDKETFIKRRAKNRAWCRYVNDRTEENFSVFKNERNDLRRMTREKKADFESKLATEVRDNPKAFWNYSRSQRKQQDDIPKLVDKDGVIIETDNQKAEALNKQFCSVFVNEPADNVPEQEIPRTTMQPINVEISDVEKRLSELNPNKSGGPDGVHPRILKEARKALATPLTMIFNKSLDEGRVPEDWKVARVTPIYKRKGEPSAPSNYRPISLTSVVCKVLEGIVREAIMSFVQETGQLNEEQHGFMPGKGCQTNLIETMDDVTKDLDEGIPVDIIYIDFSKAFDTVPHKRMISKLRGFGISPQLVTWIEDFLHDRTMYVSVKGSNSATVIVKSGIPQGSVLGPTLFVLYVNDIPRCLTSPSKLAADDLKIHRGVKKKEDNEILQEDIARLCKWCDTWLLCPNPSKCACMHLGQKNRQYTYSIRMKDSVISIPKSTCEKDLGVLVDSGLSFGKHIEDTTKKCQKLLWAIRRSISTRKAEPIKMLYGALIRPHLEYCNSALILRKKKDMRALENIQRRVTKMVTSIRNLPYEARLSELNLQSIKYRRDRGDMIMVHKYFRTAEERRLKKLLPAAEGKTRETRGHYLKLKRKNARTDMRRNSFSHRVVAPWNSLSQSVVEAKTVHTFKNRLDTQWTAKKFIYYG